jgi:hypothetical protein
MDALLATPGLAWLILAAVLAITELLMPGIFLVFVAAGAALTGVVTLIIPEFAVPCSGRGVHRRDFGRRWRSGAAGMPRTRSPAPIRCSTTASRG